MDIMMLLALTYTPGTQHISQNASCMFGPEKGIYKYF